MKTRVILFSIAAVAAVAALAGFIEAPLSKAPTAGVGGQPNVTLAGLVWEGSLDAALAKARKQGKPVLHLQMFGNLDEEFC